MSDSAKKSVPPQQLKPVPTDASKSATPDPEKSRELAERLLKIKKVEANQPRKRPQPSVSAPTPNSKLGTPTVTQSTPKRTSFYNFTKHAPNLGKNTLLKAALVILIVGGIIAFLVVRETRLQVTVQPGDLQIQPEAAVVFDFGERIELLKKSLSERIAPLQDLLKETTQSLDASRADLAGRTQSKKLLEDTIDQDEKEMQSLLKGTQDKLNTLWDGKLQGLDNEYDKKKKDFNSQIADRAKSLGLDYKPNPELDMPDVTVNAFRLALYGASKQIDVNAQRIWAENLLQEWRKFEESRSTERSTLKDQIQEVRGPVGEKIEQIKKRIANVKGEIALIDKDVELVQGEAAEYEERAADIRRKIDDAFQPFYEELLKIPADYVQFTYPIPSNNILDVREIEKNREFKPGKYLLFLRGTKNGDEHWCFQEFELKPYRTVKMLVEPSQFVPARSLLER